MIFKCVSAAGLTYGNLRRDDDDKPCCVAEPVGDPSGSDTGCNGSATCIIRYSIQSNSCLAIVQSCLIMVYYIFMHVHIVFIVYTFECHCV